MVGTADLQLAYIIIGMQFQLQHHPVSDLEYSVFGAG